MRPPAGTIHRRPRPTAPAGAPTEREAPRRESAVSLIRLVLITLYTTVLGSLAIVLSLLLPGVPVFIRVARVWSWLILRSSGIRLVVTRSPAYDPSRPSIYMSNHQSLFDVPSLTLAIRADLKFVTKRELLFIPIFGWSLWCAGFLFIDRKRRDRAVRSLARGSRKLRAGASILAFPEGTRSPTGELLPFKKGAFVLALEAGAPLVPGSISGGTSVLAEGKLRVRPRGVRIVIWAPIENARMKLDDPDLVIGLGLDP